MTTIERIRAYARNLASMTDEELQVYIDLAAGQMCASAWGNAYADGVAFLAAHLATMASQMETSAGAAGATSEVRTGDLTVKYARSGTSDDGVYGETGYGRMWLSLRQGLHLGPLIITGG